MTNPTPQQTEEAIFGAGADIYSQWDAPLGAAAFQMQFDYAEGREAPNTWSYLVFADNPDARGWVAVVVNHRYLLTALRTVADPEWSPREGLRGRNGPSEEARENVRAFLKDPEGSTDIDASTADEVLQVAVLGGVVYG